MHPIHETLALFLSHPSTKQLTESAMGSHAVDIAADKVVSKFPLLASLIPAGALSIRGIQKFGQNTFAAMFVVALLQAMVALIQYRTNPSGQLVVPPGLTFGIAKPSSKDSSLLLLTSTTELLNSTETNLSSLQIQPNEETLEMAKIIPNKYAKILQKINRWLFLLIPWATERLAFFWGRNTHVMHLGIILTLNRLFDFPNRLWAAKEEANNVIVPKADPKKLGKTPRNIVVIGDSLAVGLGSVEEFTASSNSKSETRDDANTQSYTKYENTDVDSGTGPVFPRVLAESLSRQFHQSIRWRSAGVDGGDLKWIDDLCFEVIEAKNALEILPFLKEKVLFHFWSDNRLVIIVRDFYFETRIPDEKPSVEYQVRLLFGVEVNIYKNVTINFSGPNCSGWFIRNVRNFGELEPTDNVKIPSSLFFSSRDPYETLFKDKVRESFFFESIFTGYHRYYILYRLGSLAYLPESYLTHEMVDIKAP